MKKLCLMLSAMLALLCFSCDDDKDASASKTSANVRVSRSVKNLEILQEKSTKELSFTLRARINDKEIALVVRNNTPEVIEITAPEFTYPEDWGAKLTPKQLNESGKISLAPGENTLCKPLMAKLLQRRDRII